METDHHRYLLSLAHCIIIHRTKIWKQQCPSTYEQRYTHKHTVEYYSAMRRKAILTFVTPWINLEGIMLNEINMVEKDKYCMILFLRGILKEKSQTEIRVLTSGPPPPRPPPCPAPPSPGWGHSYYMTDSSFAGPSGYHCFCTFL